MTSVDVFQGNPAEAIRIAGRALRKARQHGTRLKGVLDDLLVLIRLLRAWANGGYRAVPWRTLVVASAAVLYFVNPLDVIPDQLPGIGYLDDASVIAAVATLLRDDLRRFARWESLEARD